MEDIFNFLSENANELTNLAEDIYNSRDEIIDYVKNNVDFDAVGEFIESFTSSREENENTSEDNSFYTECGKNKSIDFITNDNFAKNAITVLTLKMLSDNKIISDFLKENGVTYNFSKIFNINIENECFCYADVPEYAFVESKFSGKLLCYAILKSKINENDKEKINEKTRKN